MEYAERIDYFMAGIKIENPKVKDLVRQLLLLDQEQDIVIEDPDTNWAVDIIHIDEYQGCVTLGGQYHEMNTYHKW